LPPIQYWFTGQAVAAFVTLLGALLTLGYGWYRAANTEWDTAHSKIESATQKEKIDRVKALLGKALDTGAGLIGDLNKKDGDQAERDTDAWVKQARDLIAAAYGDGEAALFLDSSGYVFYGDGSQKSNIRNRLDGRMRRISGLLRRSDSLTVKNDFNPTLFE